MLCTLITMSLSLQPIATRSKLLVFNFVCMTVSSFLTHIDIDECTENSNGCNQLCTNTPGSYACYCNVGYELSSDQKTCVGKLPFDLCPQQALLRSQSCRDSFRLQTPMNVLREMEDAPRHAQTVLGAMPVHAGMATCWTASNMDAMVGQATRKADEEIRS